MSVDRAFEELQAACWQNGFSRSLCCHSAPENCFDGVYTAERCCASPRVVTGPAAFGSLHGIGDHVMGPFFAELVRRQRIGGAASTTRLVKLLRSVETGLSSLYNLTRADPEDSRLSTELVSVYLLFVGYFVSLEALGSQLTARSLARVLRREAFVWNLFTGVYQNIFVGHSDYCRCMEAGEFYSHTAGHLRAAGFGRRDLVRRMFAWNTSEHHVLRGQGCAANPVEGAWSDGAISRMFTTGCASGDMAMTLLLLENCVLESEARKTIALHDAIFKLATLVVDCHDAKFWSFSVRDTAVQYAKALWALVRLPPGGAFMDKAMARRMAWDPRRGRGLPEKPWHGSCGPHEIQGPVSILLRDVDEPWEPGKSAVGPLCTEIGRFWLRVEGVPIDSTSDFVLAILVITFPWWVNPWHHLHWWIPAIWYLRVVLGLDPRSTDVGLTFPTSDADWGRAVASKVKEPRQWSYLQGDWQKDPETKLTKLEPWQPKGLHADVLGWLSSRPAAPLRYLQGRPYRRVVVGLPPMRYTVQSPPFRRQQIDEVKRFVRSTPEFLRLGKEDLERDARRKRLSIIQRSREHRRYIDNLDDVLVAVRQGFGKELGVEVLRLGSEQSWTQQFWLVARSDILAAVAGAGLGWLWAMPRGRVVVELRSKGEAVWLPCSEAWGADAREMFGGLARLAGMHHICVRPHRRHSWSEIDQPGAGPPQVSEFDRDADLVINVDRMADLLRQALQRLASPPPEDDLGPA